MRPRACLLIVLGLLLATVGEAQKKRFTFAWSPETGMGSALEVQYRAEILRVDGGATTQSTVFRTGTLTVESDGETLRLRRQDNAPDYRWLGGYQDVLDHLPHLAATVVVDRAGHFQGAMMATEALERVDPDRLTAAFATAELAAYQGAAVGAMERRFTAVLDPKTLRPHVYTFHHRLEQEPPEAKGLTLEEVSRSWWFVSPGGR